MDTSLRYAGDTKALRIHAKEKLPIDSNTRLQLHGELDTKAGSPSYLCAIFRHFYPELSASLGVGLQYNKREKLGYVIRAKKAFPVTSNGFVSFVVKGRCDADQEFKKKNYKGAAEFSWCIYNFQEDQDVRLKLGYEMFEKVPYMQIRDSNWTLSADINGGWKVRFDL